MTGNEVRKRFLEYFANKGHSIQDSSSLVPHDDPSLLFTNAGMVQFKRVFMGEEQKDFTRAVTCQRCVRAGGKHNDLENVGYTARHHTFFEMLGNFSFGDYFKKDAIDYGWEFLTKELGLPAEKLWVSVFEEDDEAFDLWEQIKELPKGRIVRLGENDNFWAMGDTGPCGPCSEIHIDLGEEVGCDSADCAVGCDCDRYLELWNLVFMQFYRDENGEMTRLPKPSIDTGMGLERVAAVLQGKFNNFDSDLFTPIIEHISSLAKLTYGPDKAINASMRVIADHARATTFLVADGVLPSNEGRGYVLRRIMRRAIRFGRTLGLENLFFGSVCSLVIECMKEAHPHLTDSKELLDKVTHNEELRFGETLDHGLTMLAQKIESMQSSQGDIETCIDGDFIFKLYDTYGFPVDIVRDVAIEKGVSLDEAGFETAMSRQREQSRRSWKGEDVAHLDAGVIKLLEKGSKTEFTGYLAYNQESVVEALIGSDGELLQKADQGQEVKIYCPSTPFYAEAGGQSGDTGEFLSANGQVHINNTRQVSGLTLHEGRVIEGSLAVGETVNLFVASISRTAITQNHSATHLLQAAMKNILGDHVKQAGSLVEADRLRFDFTHFSPLTPTEQQSIEELVNQKICNNTVVDSAVLAREEAIEQGATALFGEKYGDEVRVVTIGDFSKELCGGTHVGATGDVGFFKIISETGIAAGVRRIEAVTGSQAVSWVQALEATANDISDILSGPLATAGIKIKALLKKQKDLEQEVTALTAQLALSDLDSILQGRVDVDGVSVIAHEVFLDSPKTLREIGDKIRDKMDGGVAVLGGKFEGKAALLALVSKDLTGRIKAGALVSEAAKIVGGKGGGRPDMAQAGGPMADKLSEAIAAVPQLVRSLMS